MSVNKMISVYTALDGDAKKYLDKMESMFHGFTDIHDANRESWSYDASIGKEGVYAMLEKGTPHIKLFVNTNGWMFYLNLHQRDGKPFMAELSDFGSDRYSYDYMFGSYYNFARECGNSLCEMVSENERDAQYRLFAYDKDGQKIEDVDKAVAFGKDVLGLSHASYGFQVPEVYIEHFPKETPQLGVVTRLEDSKNSVEYSLNYKGVHGYCSGIRMVYPKDIALRDGFDKELIKGLLNPDMQEKIRDFALESRNFSEHRETMGFDARFDVRQRLLDMRDGLRNELQRLVDRNIAWEKGDNTMDKGTEKVAEIGMENDVPFDVGVVKETPLMSLADGDKNYSWNHLREKTLNGKDAAALLGDAPWRSREELLAEKRKFVTFRPEKGSAEDIRMNRGWELQGQSAKKFSADTGIELEDGAIFQSKDHAVMTARIPFQTKEGHPVHILSTSLENGYMWENGAVPANVQDECQWNMAVMGTDKSYVGCLVDNLDKDGNSVKGVEQVLHTACVERDEKIINRLVREAEQFKKEMDRPYLVINVPDTQIEKADKTYTVTLPEGAKITLPERVVKEPAKGKGYQLVLPVKNPKGQSFLYKKDDGKSMSSAEIYCSMNKVRGRILFANNRSSFRKRGLKRNKDAEIKEEVSLGK